MISLDASIIPAISHFSAADCGSQSASLQAATEDSGGEGTRTSGLMSETQAKMDHQLGLLDKYQATIKNARMEAYRQQEQVRSEAMQKRAEVLAQAKAAGEQMIRDSRASILSQVESAKQQLDFEAQELARGIASTLLGRAALDADSV